MTSTASTRRPRKDAASNRADILAAAATTIALNPHAPIDTIARAAGLSRRALYGHFDDRDALLRAVIRVGAQRYNLIADEVDDSDPAPLTLARLALALWDGAAHVQFAATVALDDTHVADTAAVLTPVRRRVLGVVERGRADGSIRTDLPAPTVARLVEEAARTVITRLDTTSPDAASIAVRAILGVAGLGWRDADDVLTAALARRAAVAEAQA
ncbi:MULTISPECIES: TetR/AcrR family transcriptional regulator [unclassified Microbacterium]|uniref:TetR/AcrR family transcriptional regulator n=1 Tax=unclassified Microbacterium TaxID=2609290 RepID=UPI003863E1C2